MKVTVNNDPNKEWKFPAIVQSESDSKALVLALSSSDNGKFTGVVLRAERHYSVGELRTDWYLSSFKPYTGSVTLEN